MSNNERTLSLLAQLACTTDGAFLGLALSYAAIRVWESYNSNSSALQKIRSAPTVRIGDLRSLIDENKDKEPVLVVVRGLVQAKPAVDGGWRSKPNVLECTEAGEKGVVLERTQTCIYNEWKGLMGWTYDLRNLIGIAWKDHKTKTLRTVPFVLHESGQWPRSDYVVVNMDESRHDIPLTTVYHNLKPVQPSPYTLLQAIFGISYPVGLLEEQKILPLGKEVSAVGVCSLQDGSPHINPCKDLPFFLSDMTKAGMVVDLTVTMNIQFWGSIIIGSVSIAILGYAIKRNWRRWNDWREQRRLRQSRDAAVAAAVEEVEDEDESEAVPDGQECAVCLTRRRKSAFLPCGHLVCCHRCALAVERDSAPKCPVCRQTITSSVRIYDS